MSSSAREDFTVGSHSGLVRLLGKQEGGESCPVGPNPTPTSIHVGIAKLAKASDCNPDMRGPLALYRLHSHTQAFL
jgi:hypothetical protein